MKKILILLILVLAASVADAQGVSPYSLRKLRFGFELNSDIWLNKPDDLNLKNINRGMNLYLLYNNRLGESKFAFAGGLSLASQNMYLKNAMLDIDTLGVSFFNPILGGIPHQRNKLNLNYLEIPLEFSYHTRGHFTFALGATAGLLISDKTKYKGKDFGDDPGKDIKMKTFNHENFLDYRIGTYAVVGYKWVNIKAYYGLTKLFEDGLGPDMSPLTIGVLVRPY
jgi:hypothetical protein